MCLKNSFKGMVPVILNIGLDSHFKNPQKYETLFDILGVKGIR